MHSIFPPSFTDLISSLSSTLLSAEGTALESLVGHTQHVSVVWLVFHIGPEWNIRWFAVKFDVGVHGLQRMDHDHLGDPLTFPSGATMSFLFVVLNELSQQMLP